MTIKTEFIKEESKTNYILDFGECIKLDMTTKEHNEFILKEFYKAIEWLLSKGYDEYIEMESNTINPCQQNAFIPLRVYRVFKNGHYRTFKIFARFFSGSLITEE